MITPRRTSDEVARELASIGKYKVRLITDPRKPGEQVLDIREYLESGAFQGFTRRGIRLSDRAEMELLRDILGKVLEEMGRKK